MAKKITKHLEDFAFAVSEMECASDLMDAVAGCLHKSRSIWTAEQLSDLAEKMDAIEKVVAVLKAEVIHLMSKF